MFVTAWLQMREGQFRRSTKQHRRRHCNPPMAVEALEERTLLTALDFSTFLGSPDGDGGATLDIEVDRSGNAFLAFRTDDPQGLEDALGMTLDGPCDGSGNCSVLLKITDPTSAPAVAGSFAWDSGNVNHDLAFFEPEPTVAGDELLYLKVGGTPDENQDVKDTGKIVDQGGAKRDITVLQFDANTLELTSGIVIGGDGNDVGETIEVGPHGKVYLGAKAGEESVGFKSDGGNFTDPQILGFQPTIKGTVDGFIGTLNFDDPNSPFLEYGSFVANDTGDNGVNRPDSFVRGIAVDTAGNLYGSGQAGSKGFLNGVAAGVQTVGPVGKRDVYVLKVDPAVGGADGLEFAARLGGGGDDGTSRVAVQPDGSQVVLAGRTGSSDFPVIDGFDMSLGGKQDVFVTRLNVAADNSVTLDYSAFLGGENEKLEIEQAVELDSTGRIFVTGVTDAGDFPTNNGAQSIIGGKDDTFVSVLDPSVAGTDQLVDSTFLGGKSDEKPTGLALFDSDGTVHAYVAGKTSSDAFPTTDNALDPTFNGQSDIFATVLDNIGQAPAPQITIDDVSVTEGDSGTVAADFTVSLSRTSDHDVTVEFATQDGTATTADNDYQAASGTLTIPNGSTSGTISVTVNGDTTEEGDETFLVNLANAGGATIAHSQSTGTIVGDDGAVTEITVDRIDPNAMPAGSTISVEVFGSGFQNGADLTFENGSGPTPEAFNVTLQDVNGDGVKDIMADVHTKNGGPKRERVWDVVVTNPDGSSGRCESCFTVDGSSSALQLGTHGDRESSGSTLLSDAVLDSVVQQAAAFWQSRGVPAEATEAIGRVDVHIADFAGSQLGAASGSGTIWIDGDAAGFGWSLRSDASDPIRVDFRSVVTHELGHVLGLDHADAGRHKVMAPTLAPGAQMDVYVAGRLQGNSLMELVRSARSTWGFAPRASDVPDEEMDQSVWRHVRLSPPQPAKPTDVDAAMEQLAAPRDGSDQEQPQDGLLQLVDTDLLAELAEGAEKEKPDFPTLIGIR